MASDAPHPPRASRRLAALPAVFILSLALSLTLLAALSPFEGAAPGDLTRGLSPADIQPPLLDDRAYLDGYTLWYQGEKGESVMVSLLLSNLAGSPPRPGFSLVYYPVSGPPVHGELELPGSDLALSGPPLNLSFGGNYLREEGAAYGLHLKAKTGLVLDLKITPKTKGYRQGNGRVPVGDDTFFMALMAPGGDGLGTLTLPQGEAVALRGGVYLDHSWQDAWPHKVASRWFNLRFYGESQRGAFTTWVTPEGQAMAHGVLVKGGAIVYGTRDIKVSLEGGKADPDTGHKVPTSVSLDLGGGRSLKAELGPALERRDLLGDLNPLLKGAIGALVARPYSWRFRGRGQLRVDGVEGEGVVLAEMIQL